ncbi:MAG TPA: DUF695 domain-containing protein [Acidothermaceae bacterium]
MNDQHIAVVLPYEPRRDDLLPDPEALRELALAENELVGILGASAEFVAAVTAEGRRTLHFYADSENPHPAAVIRQWVHDNPEARWTIAVDPGWSAVAALARAPLQPQGGE